MAVIAISGDAAEFERGLRISPCVREVNRILQANGFDVRVFAADGGGGRAMEAAILAGEIAGVLDLNLSELVNELAGGIHSAGPDRLTAASLRGIPQVIVPGAVDGVSFGSKAPAKYAHRLFLQRSENFSLMRSSPEENDRLGREIALRVSASSGPAAIVLPKRGVSESDQEGSPFHWPEADVTLFRSIRNWISPQVRMLECDLHINEPEFAQIVAVLLIEMVGANRQAESQ
jgi:uncharacterized protein (UPF0261 family)